MIPLRETTAGVSFKVRVQPRASRAAITGVLGDEILKIALAAPPVEGRANEALVRFFAELFDVPPSAIEIVSGGQSRNKVVCVAGANIAHVRDRLTV